MSSLRSTRWRLLIRGTSLACCRSDGSARSPSHDQPCLHLVVSTIRPWVHGQFWFVGEGPAILSVWWLRSHSGFAMKYHRQSGRGGQSGGELFVQVYRTGTLTFVDLFTSILLLPMLPFMSCSLRQSPWSDCIYDYQVKIVFIVLRTSGLQRVYRHNYLFASLWSSVLISS